MTDAADFQPESSAAQRAYVAIADRMASGELAPGAWLREESLAASLGISRTPVREALRKLNSEGLVRLERNRGAQVVAWNREQVLEIYGLRAVVEGYVASIAARKVGEEDLRKLAANLAEYERVIAVGGQGSIQQAAVLNNEFHSIILDATGNDSLRFLLTGVLGLPLVRRTFLRYTGRDLARSIEHHRELLEAFRRRDADTAEMIMKVHIRTAQHAMLRQEELQAD
ncbi:GntR family transcriptional regulator [Pseudonocardia acaciae]|uniref:GntR family transcriptional regulator n=1 Tax=Pseudonocardia acaciae TaxID=551276 RepID=UPI00048EE9BD|nr:GntR family transcriptional regulator [Pseudonocardia acaciae]